MTVSINPIIQTNAPGSFGIQWDGLIAGTAQPDPETRFALASGWLDPAESLPMWGGVPIAELIPTTVNAPLPAAQLPGTNQQSMIQRATNVTGGATAKSLTGFSVFDQAYGMINTPQSPVPLAAGYMQVMYYRMGSMARIALPIDPTVVAALYAAPTLTALNWDLTNGYLTTAGTQVGPPLIIGPIPVKILRVYATGCMTVSYDAGTGFATWNRSGACALVMI